MTAKPIAVLFVCTGNTARSILAEALLNRLGAGRFVAYSAGSQPKGVVNPGALRLLAREGLATDELRSKSWTAFEGPHAPTMDVVTTVCDSAAGEACPIWPGAPVTAHWGIPDPAAVTEPEAAVDEAFATAFGRLQARIAPLVALPDAVLADPAALKAALARIAAEAA
jgi:arsenate reductase